MYVTVYSRVFMISMCVPLITVGITFTQSSYTVNENSLEVQPVINLTRPLSESLTIQVIDSSRSATSK